MCFDEIGALLFAAVSVHVRRPSRLFASSDVKFRSPY